MIDVARKSAVVCSFALALSCSSDDAAPGPVAAAGASASGGSAGAPVAGSGGAPAAGAGAVGGGTSEGMAADLGLAGAAGSGAPLMPIIPVIPAIPVAVSEPDPPGTNLAVNTLSCASNEEGGPKIIPFAVDGDPTTMWCAINGNLGYYYGVDLGSSHALTGARIIWEFEDRVYQYRIETSLDAVAWSPWIEQAANNAIGSVVHAAAAEARYVRIVWNGLQVFPVTWSCMREFEVWGFALDGGALPGVVDADAVETPVAPIDASADAAVSTPTCDLD